MLKELLFRQNTPRWVIFFIDLSIVIFSIVLAYLLRFNFAIPDNELPLIKYAALSIIGIRSISFLIGKPYSFIIRYTSTEDSKRILLISFIGSLIIAGSNFISYQLSSIFIIPFSIVILEFLLTTTIMIASRTYIRLMYEDYRNPMKGKFPTLIFGAGEAGLIAKRAIEKNAKSEFAIVGFVDDDTIKSKRRLENKPIYRGDELSKVLQEKEISHLIISPQNLKKSRLNQITLLCLENKVQVLNVPSASKWINGELSLKQIKKVKIEDLLGRESIELSKDLIGKQIKGKCILISGAAGSIGSEIVRQVVKYDPKKVIMLDQAESALYELEMELSASKSSKSLEIVIGDICHEERMRQLFKSAKPDIVYHAAAYKHVPLMENNPFEAVRTNVMGTKILADLANESKVQTFVMISTDKAVNPTNVMGASKRVAEIYAQSLNAHSETKFITTRFGNVLGSNGSVIPLFRKQIEKGGPITVTDPEITRYFMTIPEACQLVIEAGSSGKGGEIFIFDMGQSIKIKDLASEMIKLSGLEEGTDIQIVYTGLRPGEKLYEELLNDKENTLPTHHQDIMIAKVETYSLEEIKPKIEELVSIDLDDEMKLVKMMKEIVPEYVSNNSKYEALDKAENQNLQQN